MVSEADSWNWSALLLIWLNPYCSGIWSRSWYSGVMLYLGDNGLILIVVEYGLGDVSEY